MDSIKNMGFHYATISGTTIAVTDLTVPEETFTLEKKQQTVRALETPDGPIVPLPLGIREGGVPLSWSLTPDEY